MQGSYFDGDIGKLMAVSAKALGNSEIAAQRWFGREAMSLLAKRYPGFFKLHRSARSFDVSVNNIIHREVRKVYPGADVPTLEFKPAEDGSLIFGYHPLRRLCALAQGFIAGAATLFHAAAEVERLECMPYGKPQSAMRIVINQAV